MWTLILHCLFTWNKFIGVLDRTTFNYLNCLFLKHFPKISITKNSLHENIVCLKYIWYKKVLIFEDI